MNCAYICNFLLVRTFQHSASSIRSPICHYLQWYGLAAIQCAVVTYLSGFLRTRLVQNVVDTPTKVNLSYHINAALAASCFHLRAKATETLLAKVILAEINRTTITRNLDSGD